MLRRQPGRRLPSPARARGAQGPARMAQPRGSLRVAPSHLVGSVARRSREPAGRSGGFRALREKHGRSDAMSRTRRARPQRDCAVANGPFASGARHSPSASTGSTRMHATGQDLACRPAAQTAGPQQSRPPHRPLIRKEATTSPTGGIPGRRAKTSSRPAIFPRQTRRR
jgi:hypothetical protein